MVASDDNIRFVNEQLRPAIESRRAELARMYGSEWKHRFRLMTTLTAGAPARILSIQNSLRRFQPHTLHVWQLKSFWHEYPNVQYLKDSEVEFQRFRSTEVSPPIPTTTIRDSMISELVRCPSCQAKLDLFFLCLTMFNVFISLLHILFLMRRQIVRMHQHRRSFELAIESRNHEISRFWLRKTKQPVLAILCTQKDGEAPVFCMQRTFVFTIVRTIASMCFSFIRVSCCAVFRRAGNER